MFYHQFNGIMFATIPQGERKAIFRTCHYLLTLTLRGQIKD